MEPAGSFDRPQATYCDMSSHLAALGVSKYQEIHRARPDKPLAIMNEVLMMDTRCTMLLWSVVCGMHGLQPARVSLKAWNGSSDQYMSLNGAARELEVSVLVAVQSLLLLTTPATPTSSYSCFFMSIS